MRKKICNFVRNTPLSNAMRSILLLLFTLICFQAGAQKTTYNKPSSGGRTTGPRPQKVKTNLKGKAEKAGAISGWSAVNGLTSTNAVCPPPAVSGPASGSTGQALTYSVAPAAGTTVQWDFCEGDLTGQPLLKASPVLQTYSGNITLVNDSGTYYGFVPAQSAGNAFTRLRFGNSLENNPVIEPMGNPFGLFSNTNPVSIKFIKEGGIWYALVTNSNTNVLSRLKFQAGLGSSPTQVSTVTFAAPSIPAVLSQPYGLELLKDGDSLYAFVTNINSNLTTNNFIRLHFGTSITNVPTVDFLNNSNMSSFGGLGQFSIFKECNQWYALVPASNQIFRVSFGTSLNGDISGPSAVTPLNTAISAAVPGLNAATALGGMVGIAAGRDAGIWQAFVTTSGGYVTRFGFGNGPGSAPDRGESLSNLFGASAVPGISLYKQNSDWFAYSCNRNNSMLYRLRWAQHCGASPQTASGTSATVTYSYPDSVRIGATFTDAQGNQTEALTLAAISPSGSIASVCPAETITLPASVCLNTDFAVSSTQSNGNSLAWDLCPGDLGQNPLVGNFPAASLPSSSTFAYEIVQEGGIYYALSVGSDQALTLSVYDSTLNNSPRTVKSYSAADLNGVLYFPAAMRFFKDRGNWYGIVINNPAATYPVAVLSFGASLTYTPAVSVLSNNNLFFTPKGVEVLKENGKIYALISNSGRPLVTQLSFDSVITNLPSVTQISLASAGASTTYQVSALRDCNTWCAFVTEGTVASGNLYRLNYTKGLDNKPTIDRAPLNIPSAGNLRLLRDGVNFYAYVQNSGNNNIFNRVSMGRSLLNPVYSLSPVTLPAGTSLAGAPGFSMVQQSGSQWVLAAANSQNAALTRLIFPNACPGNKLAFPGSSQTGIRFSKKGKYPVTLTVTDAQGNVHSQQDTLRIRGPVSPKIKINGAFCPGQNITITDVSIPDSATTTWTTFWNFGDLPSDSTSTQSTDKQATHAYAAPGFYKVRLTVVESSGCTITSDPVTVRIFSLPVPAFNYGTACGNDTVAFTNQSTAGTDTVVRYSWRVLGRPDTSAKQNPKFFFPDAGTYQVQLTLYGRSGCSVQATQLVTILPGLKAGFHVSNLCLGDSAVFTDSSSYQTGSSGSLFTYDFGDGSPLVTAMPPVKHAYAAAGVYSPKCTVVNSSGCSSRVRQSIRIVTKPRLVFGHPPVTLTGDSVLFSDSSRAAFSSVISRRWNFGDPAATGPDSISNAVLAKHSYGRAGTYTVRLGVTNAQGCRSDTSFPITVLNKCVSFSENILPNPPPLNGPLSLTTSGDTSNKYSIDFCAGDLNAAPLIATATWNSVAGYAINVVMDGEKAYGFMNQGDIGNNNYLSRITFPNSDLNKTPTSASLGSLGGKLSDCPAIKFYKEAGKWYGLALGKGLNKLVLVSFGDSLTTPNPQASVVAGNLSTQLINPQDLEIVPCGDSLYVLVACNSGTSNGNLVRLSFGNSILNRPSVSYITDASLANTTQFNSLSVIKDCNRYHALLLSSGQVFYMDFGVSVAYKPAAVSAVGTQIGSYLSDPNLVNSVVTVSLLRDMGGIYAFFITNSNSASSGNLIRVTYAHGFAGGITQAVNLGSNGLVINPWGIKFVRNKSQYFAFSIDKLKGVLYRYKFPEFCPAGVTAAELRGTDTAHTSYSEPGKYYITTTGYDTSGAVAQHLDSVTVSPSGNAAGCPRATISGPKTYCVGEPLRDSVISTPGTSVEWRYCTGALAADSAHYSSIPLTGRNGAIGLDVIYDEASRNYLGYNMIYADQIAVLNFADLSGLAPSVTKLGVNTLDATAIKMFRASGKWYGLVTNTGGTLTLLSFGAVLNTGQPGQQVAPPVASTIAAPTGYFQTPKALDVVVQRGNVYAFIANGSSNFITVLRFGKSPESVPSISTFTVTNSTGLSGISLIKECDTYAAIVTDGTGNVFKLVFSKGLNAAPDITQAPTDIVNLTDAFHVKTARDGNRYYAFISSGGHIKRIAFGKSIIAGNFSRPVNLTPFGYNQTAFCLLPLQNGKWSLLGTLYSSVTTITRTDFASACLVSKDSSSALKPGGVYFLSDGYGHFSCTVTDSLGNSSVISDSVAINNPVTVQFSKTGNRCPGSVISFRNTSIFGNLSGGNPQFAWNFGDTPDPSAVQSMASDTLYRYSRPGTYKVVLRISVGNCTAADTQLIKIYAKPTPAFTYPDVSTSCTFDSIPFTDASVANGDTITSYLWTVVPGNDTSRLANPKFVFPLDQTYTVTLRVTGISGCDSTLRQNFHPGTAGTHPNFYAQFGSNCEGDAVQLRDSTITEAGITVSTYSYDLHNGSPPARVKNPNVVLGPPGNYPVTLTIRNNNGCTASVTKIVSVYKKPTAVITVNPSPACARADITFSFRASVQKGLAGQHWDFGDGATSEALVPLHQYRLPGTYTVKLTVTDLTGCKGSVQQSVTVTTAPTAKFGYSLVCPGEPVTFTDTSKGDNLGNPITGYFWDFGSAGTITEAPSANPPITHTIQFPADSDSVHVLLRVNGGGCYNVLNKTILFKPRLKPLIKTEIGCTGTPTLFTDVSTLAGQAYTADTLHRTWRINYVTYHGKSVLADITEAGTYYASLTLTSPSGCTKTRTDTVYIGNAPVASFILGTNGADTLLTAPPYVLHTRNTSQNALRYLWKFGDGDTSTQANPLHTYKQEGTYNVTLTADRNGLCRDSSSKSVTVVRRPAPDVAVTKSLPALSGHNVSVSAEVYNAGNVELKSIYLTATVNGTFSYSENWTGSLLPKQRFIYTFKGFLQDSLNPQTYVVCVGAALPPHTLTDINPANNDTCGSVSDGFLVLDVNPIPALQQPVLLRYSLPADGAIQIKALDIMGREAYLIADGNETAGVREHTLPASALVPGFYYVRFTYQGSTVIRKIIVE